MASSTSDKVVIEKVTVKRRLGLLSCISFIIGNIIGSGIFISPKNVLAHTGSVGLCLVIWTVCGVISMCAALVFAELGTLIPKSGGEHAYFLKTYGSFVAFIYIWVNAFALSPGGGTVRVLTMIEYLSEVIFDDCGPSENMKKVMALTTILLTAITNSFSVRLTARIQIFFAFIKLSGLVVIMIGGIIWMSKGRFGSLTTGFDGSTTDIQDVALSIYSGLFAYDGWNSLNHVIEEVKNPERNLPLAIIISVLLVTGVYLLVNISYLAVLSKPEFLSSWAVGVTWAEKVMSPAVVFIPIVVSCSVYGAINASSFAASRVFFQAGREGHLPEVLSYISIHSFIPIPSIIFLTTLSIAFLIPGNISSLLNLLNFLSWMFIGMSMLAVIILRWKMKDAKRVIKVPLVIPALIILLCIYLVVSPFIQNPKREFLYALAFLGVGAVLYFPIVHFKLRIPGMDTTTRLGQCLLEVVPTHITEDKAQ